MIDWENFKYKLKSILGDNNKPIDYCSIDYKKLFNTVFDIPFEEIVCYMARLKKHKEFPEKSMQLIEAQRKLKTYLEKQGLSTVMCGVVRSNKTSKGIVFKEKGVDVYIAVDIVRKAYSKDYSEIYIASSDSDMNPAIKEAQSQKTKIVYVGFQKMPNKGIMYNSNESVLIRDNEIINSVNN